MTTRVVHQADAIGWLDAAGVVAGASFVTSLPDVSELAPMRLPEWRAWFTATAVRVLRATPDDGVTIFYQTDTLTDGRWMDKGHLIHCAADEAGVPLLFHRIACRFQAGTTRQGRPGYGHLLGFSRGVVPAEGHPRLDVIASPGRMTWARAIPMDACIDACRFVHACTRSTTIIDPFCGYGTVLAAAEAFGFDTVGVELSRKRAEKARELHLAPEERGKVARGGLESAGQPGSGVVGSGIRSVSPGTGGN